MSPDVFQLKLEEELNKDLFLSSCDISSGRDRVGFDSDINVVYVTHKNG